MIRAAKPAWAFDEPEIMELGGPLDAASAPRVEEDIRLCIKSGALRMILDFYHVPAITGAGLRAILTAARDMQAAGGYLAVCNLQPPVEEMFRASGLSLIVPFYEGQAEAAQALAVG